VGGPTLEELQTIEAEVASAGCDINDITAALLEEHKTEISAVSKRNASARKHRSSVGPGIDGKRRNRLFLNYSPI
jgi:hypothetical protein